MHPNPPCYYLKILLYSFSALFVQRCFADAQKVADLSAEARYGERKRKGWDIGCLDFTASRLGHPLALLLNQSQRLTSLPSNPTFKQV